MLKKISNKKKIVVLIGDDLRHQYFLFQLNSKHRISAVFIEKSEYPQPIAETENEKKAWTWFFERRKTAEYETITPTLNIKTLNSPDIFHVKKNGLNSLDTLTRLKKISPDFIACFGIGLLHETILSNFPDIIFNLHVGIPEYYRGSSCNFWPIYNSDLKNLGATVHLIEKGIDTGKIAGAKPIILEPKDNEQTLMLKTLQGGTQLMDETIDKWKKGRLSLKQQTRKGKLYKMKDLKPLAILKVKNMVESGELQYLIELNLNKYS
ncbi:MAG: formyltransferase family protein [Nitrospinota bacterium]|nr:formyltransferase family protein [Nitrospinota bacterium]